VLPILPQDLVVKILAKLELELNNKVRHEISLDSWISHPHINYIWDTKKLLEEPLKLEVENKIRYGREEDLKEIVVKMIMEKTEEQKSSLRESPEYKQCLKFEEHDQVLAPICMKVRHDAASLDKLKMKIELPHEPKQVSDSQNSFSSSLTKKAEFVPCNPF
jgi:hypothetical protein